MDLSTIMGSIAVIMFVIMVFGSYAKSILPETFPTPESSNRIFKIGIYGFAASLVGFMVAFMFSK